MIHGWVTMDNQFHPIVFVPDLSATLRDLKKFTAQLLRAQVEREGRNLNRGGSRGAVTPPPATETEFRQNGCVPKASETV